MSDIIPIYIDSVKTGAVQTYKNMAVVPLLGKDSNLDYLVFDEALKNGLTVKETGNVPKLNIYNGTGKQVLILQGEYVLGGYQNRMMAQNMFLKKGFGGEVPVNCVQQGRWTFNTSKDFSNSGVRASPKVYSAAYNNQSEVWSRVKGLTNTLNCFSSTNDYNEIHKQKKNDISEYEEKFTYTPGSVGMVIAIQNNGKPEYVLDLFDNHKTMEKNFKKLIKASALEAIISGNGLNSLDVEGFLSNVKEANFEERKAISLGKDYKLNHVIIEGSALTFEDMPLYINANSKNIPLVGIRKEQTGIRRRPIDPSERPHIPLDGPYSTRPIDDIPFWPYRDGDRDTGYAKLDEWLKRRKDDTGYNIR